MTCCPDCWEWLCKIGRFAYHIAPALVGVVGGGWIIQRFFVKRANQAAYVDSLTKDLDQLQNDTLRYWILDPKSQNGKEECPVLEQKIKGAIKAITSDLGYYTDRYRIKTAMTPLMAEVSDACTGGAFESANRKPDKGRYLMVVNTIHRVKVELRRGKL